MLRDRRLLCVLRRRHNPLDYNDVTAIHAYRRVQVFIPLKKHTGDHLLFHLHFFFLPLQLKVDSQYCYSTIRVTADNPLAYLLNPT